MLDHETVNLVEDLVITLAHHLEMAPRRSQRESVYSARTQQNIKKGQLYVRHKRAQTIWTLR